MTDMPRQAILAGLMALAVAGCSEVDFMDTLGIGKNVPNERLVATNPPLSVPPDLRLPPPGRSVDGQGTAAAGEPATARTALASPPADATVADAAPATYAAAGKQATTGPAVANQGAASGGAQPPANDVYAIYRKHGINPYKPDGTPKTVLQLNRELAEKIREEKKRKNPNYGTIFNIGSIFGD